MRILLADNRARTRFALRTLLGQVPGVEISGEAADAAGLLAQAKAACPDLVLLDWGLRDLAAASLLPELRKLCPGLRVIALSGRAEDEDMVLAPTRTSGGRARRWRRAARPCERPGGG